MATPNYGYEKRQRELAKKKKKEEKVREREQRKQFPVEAGQTSQETLQNGMPEANPGDTNPQ